MLEGVAFSLRDTFEIFAATGIPVREVRLAGGGARSEVWRQIEADVYARRTVLLQNTEGAAYGAALLALVGAGVFNSVPEACKRAIAVATEVEVNRANAAEYNALYPIYTSLYSALRCSMHELGRLESRISLAA